MSLYTVTCRGALRTKSGPVSTGGDVEMSDAEANSLPPGSVALKAQTAPALPSASPIPAPVAPPSPPEPLKGRKGNKP